MVLEQHLPRNCDSHKTRKLYDIFSFFKFFFLLVISTDITVKWTLLIMIPGMGTEIQANAFFAKNHHVFDLNGNGKNGVGPFCHHNQTRRNGQDPDQLMTCVYQNGYSVYDIGKVRQTILKHESTFRNQLQELHRLYRRQRDLMNEIKLGEIKEAPSLNLARLGDALGKSFTNSHFEPKDFFGSSLDGMDKGLSLCNFELSSGRTGNERLFHGHDDKRRVDEHPGTQDFCTAKSPISSRSVLAEPQNELLSTPFQFGESLFVKKRKIFGVEIYEGNNDSCNAVFNTPTTVRRNDSNYSESSLWNSISFKENLELVRENVKDDRPSIRLLNSFNGPDQRKDIDPENPKGELPWFLRNRQLNVEPSKVIKGSYFMNLDSLQNCSQTFFKKADIVDGSFQSLKQDQEISSQNDNLSVDCAINEINNKTQSAKKILGFPIFHNFNVNCSSINGGSAEEAKNDEIDPKKQHETKNLDYTSNLRLHIDLNLSLCEEDAPSALSLPETIVKIATTEIDLEAPAVIEPESMKPEVFKEKSEISYEEAEKRAADALFCISCEKNVINEFNEPLEAESTDSLKWFAEIISSQCGEDVSVPEGMDDFEFMTLKLEDIKDGHHLYRPMLLNIESEREETGRTGTICEGSRRGRLRRKRQQKNFQKDVLPNLVTLTRHEMKEDLKAFEEIHKGEDRNRHLSKKKGKGRKRLAGPIKSHCLNGMSREARAVEGSLVGWGKRTKRLPRQRCPNLYRAIPVKC